MDILDSIKKDHRQIETVFSEIETAQDSQKLYNCFNQLYEEINLHAEVEAKIFYPALEDCGNKELVAAAKEEHDEAKKLLEEIEFLSPTSEEFKVKIKELKQMIQEHIQEEENELFSIFSQYIDPEKRSKLGTEFTSFRTQLQSEI